MFGETILLRSRCFTRFIQPCYARDASEGHYPSDNEKPPCGGRENSRIKVNHG